MANVLLVDDDTSLLEILKDYLERFEHRVNTTTSGERAVEMVANASPDVVVLDVSMPEISGWDVLRKIRERSSVPVIMLTARTEEPEILQGFALGADDYVGKPFSFAQLEARIRAVIRTSRGAVTDGNGVMAQGDLRVDLDSHRVSRGGENVKLTPTEFRLLVTLMEHPGKIFSPEQLVRRVWGEEYATESDYVRRYIWYLRQKIEANPDEPRYIRNERNVGYYFAVSQG